MADKNIIETQDRFKKAKERYSAMMQQTSKKEDKKRSNLEEPKQDQVFDLVKMLQNNSESLVAKTPRIVPSKLNFAANDNKMDIPVPLPVRPIEPESILNQQKTNDLLNQMQKTIVATSLPQPVKIDDKNLAHEKTLREAVGILGSLLINIESFSSMLIKQFEYIFGSLDQTLKDQERQAEKEKGFTGRMMSKFFNYIQGVDKDKNSLSTVFVKVTKPLTETAKKTTNWLKKIYDIQAQAYLSESDRARQLNEEDQSPKKLWFEKYLSEDSKLAKAFHGINSMFNVFKSIGNIAEKSVDKFSGGSMMGLLSGGSGVLPIIGKFLGLFGGIAGFVTMIVGSAAFAMLYSMFKHPEQLVALLGAFGDLFTKAILPALEWITKEIVPPLSIAFAALLVAADYLLDTVGTFLNDKITYIIGTALPEVLIMFGKMIDTAWQGLKEVFFRILGVFGVGKYGENGIIHNLTMAIFTIADSLLEIISIGVTEVIKSLGLADFFGLKSGESIYGRFKRFLMEDIPNFVMGLVNSTVNYISEINPMQIIKDKLNQFIDAIVSIIPSWNDMKKWMADSIPEFVPDDIRNWMLDKLDVKENTPVIQPVTKDISDKLNAPISAWDKINSYEGTVINAPVHNDNRSSYSSSNKIVTGSISSTRPSRSQLDDMITRANPY